MWWIFLLMMGCVTEPEKKPGAPEAARQAKAKTGKKPPTQGQKRQPTKKSPAKPKTFAKAGPVTGLLQFETVGEKTKATLKMTWEGGEATAFLGVTPGTCAASEVQPLPDGTVALWWATCESADKKADFAVGQKGTTLWVQRAVHTEEGLGEFSEVRALKLAEGAELSVE